MTPPDASDARRGRAGRDVPGGDVPGGDGRGSGRGPGRLLVAVYGVFAISASARAGVQLVTSFEDAPLAYLLSAVAAVVYVVATVALARDARRTAWAAIGAEAVGVLVVGAASVLDPAAFPDETVWSGFGRGYGFVPLVLPFVGLAWLLRLGRGRAA